MVEMGDFFPQDEIFQQRQAARSGAQGVLIIGDAHALIGGQRIAFTPLRCGSRDFNFSLSASGDFMLPGAVGCSPGAERPGDGL